MSMDEYIISHGPHEIAKELDQVEAQLGRPLHFAIGKDSTHTVYRFPNGVVVSLIYFPHGITLGLSSQKYETMLIETCEMERFSTMEQVNAYLHEVYSKKGRD